MTSFMDAISGMLQGGSSGGGQQTDASQQALPQGYSAQGSQYGMINPYAANSQEVTQINQNDSQMSSWQSSLASLISALPASLQTALQPLLGSAGQASTTPTYSFPTTINEVAPATPTAYGPTTGQATSTAQSANTNSATPATPTTPTWNGWSNPQMMQQQQMQQSGVPAASSNFTPANNQSMMYG